MKPDHRHELKTNELAKWLANSPQWAKENLRTIIYVSIVLVLIIVSVCIHWYKKNVESVRKHLRFTSLISQLPESKIRILQTQAKGVDTSFMLLQTADNLRDIAQNTKDDAVAAFALIKRAETLRCELHYRAGTVSKQDLTSQTNRAKAAYTQAIEKSSAAPTLAATAKFGLGLCEEELGNFYKAKQIYRDVAANPDFEGTAAVTAAKQRLNTMADYQQKVVFKQTPKPSPAKPIQPPIKLPIDTNLVPLTEEDASANSPPSQ